MKSLRISAAVLALAAAGYAGSALAQQAPADPSAQTTLPSSSSSWGSSTAADPSASTTAPATTDSTAPQADSAASAGEPTSATAPGETSTTTAPAAEDATKADRKAKKHKKHADDPAAASSTPQDPTSPQ
jgi:hypothetical protein